MSIESFKELGLDELTLSAISKMGFEKPSAIQTAAIPLLLQGRDVTGQARTGTGKTAAFGIPIIQGIDPSEKAVQSVVVCPTRELAVQVAGELEKLAYGRKGLKILAVYGGEKIQNQLKALKKGVQIVVGTPGRMKDHLDRGTLSMAKVKMAVLDEADEMLNMGFLEDMEEILAQMPEQRQTVLFSATMPAPIVKIAKRFQKNPEFTKVTDDKLTGANIEQFFYDIYQGDKTSLIVKTMQFRGHKMAIVFCNTKVRVDQVAAELSEFGIKAQPIHGDLNQPQRNKVLGSFRKGSTSVLVATDVAARGIDVVDVDAVFNFDIPYDPEYYVHRIGRTGRAGKPGQSFSFVCGSNDFRRLKMIESYSKSKIERIDPPSNDDLRENRTMDLFKKLLAIRDGEIPESSFRIMDQFIEMGLSSRQLTAALLTVLVPETEKKSEIKSRKSSDMKKGGKGRPGKFRQRKPDRKYGGHGHRKKRRK